MGSSIGGVDIALRSTYNLHVPIQGLHHGISEDGAAKKVHFEGEQRLILLFKIERDPDVRKTCLAHHGHVCASCGDDTEKLYGLGTQVEYSSSSFTPNVKWRPQD
jgi:predicted restriction endonuclease